jgi:hypothetical protein
MPFGTNHAFQRFENDLIRCGIIAAGMYNQCVWPIQLSRYYTLALFVYLCTFLGLATVLLRLGYEIVSPCLLINQQDISRYQRQKAWQIAFENISKHLST